MANSQVDELRQPSALPPALKSERETMPPIEEKVVQQEKTAAASAMKYLASSLQRGGEAATKKQTVGPEMAALSGVGAIKSLKRPRFELRQFELGPTVGTGTFGRVKLVRHSPSARFYALKIFKKCDILRLKQLEHLKSEIRILLSLQHPNIANMLGFFQDDKRVFMVLEYIPGGELFTHLRRVGRVDEPTARFYAAQVTLCFENLHGKSIAYRDLKPENVLLTRTGYLKLTDFGFAKVVVDKTWTLCGTPEYLAPEIIQSRGHGQPVDWWALGVLLFELLAGYPPFYDENPFGIYQKILAGRLDFPRHFELRARDLIKKLLTADLTRRIGCLKNGAADVKRHKWFARINFDDLLAGTIPAPYVPAVESDGDTKNFDDYPDSPEDSATALTATDKLLFSELDSF